MIEILQSATFANWLSHLKDRRARARIQARLDRMADGNFGDIAPVGDGISEACVHYGPGYRLYFISRGRQLVVLLCGGDKASQPGDIQRARQIAHDWKENVNG